MPTVAAAGFANKSYRKGNQQSYLRDVERVIEGDISRDIERVVENVFCRVNKKVSNEGNKRVNNSISKRPGKRVNRVRKLVRY
ncbi:MAG: hypothetical protein GX477_03125 [Clostridiaceae bacterium]|jgi:hypothetical protein|nr:hypothetical protein [Clostridiaceae bacterium]